MGDRRFGWAACAGAVMMLFAAAMGGQAYGAGAAAPRIEAASVRAPLAPGRPGVGYLTISGGAKTDRIVAASSPVAQRIEFHRSSLSAGVARMERVEGVTLPAGGTLRFAPGGDHLMLFGLEPGVREVPITLRFASGRTVAATARVEAMGGITHMAH